MPIGAYVHYPTISTDMFNRVKNREVGVTNSVSITSSSWKSSLKLLYVALRGPISENTHRTLMPDIIDRLRLHIRMQSLAPTKL
jgi:hypothetical protein